MPKIILPDGTPYRYKTIPLFPGVKRIDKEKASANLSLLRRILDRDGIRFHLAYGTTLGIIREGDFISHDEDIDIGLSEEYRSRFLSLLPELRKMGFELCRFDRRDLYSIMRDGEYIDLYFFRPYGEKHVVCSGLILMREFIDNLRPIRFRGEEYLIPSDHERYFVEEYGEDWRTPIQWNNYSYPTYKVLLFKFKEHLKDIIPQPLFEKLAKKADRRMNEISRRRLRRLEEYDARQGGDKTPE